MRTPEGVSLPRASFSALTAKTSLKACIEVPWRVWSCLEEALETRKLHSNLHHLEMRRAAGFAKLLPRGSISIWVHSDWVWSWLVHLHQEICVPMQRGARNTGLKGAQMLAHSLFLPESHHISALGSQPAQAMGHCRA